jgi:hypothetical protein
MNAGSISGVGYRHEEQDDHFDQGGDGSSGGRENEGGGHKNTGI